MRKQKWYEPKFTEIEVKTTEDNKQGLQTDAWTPATNNLLVGEIVPDHSCS